MRLEFLAYYLDNKNIDGFRPRDEPARFNTLSGDGGAQNDSLVQEFLRYTLVKNEVHRESDVKCGGQGPGVWCIHYTYDDRIATKVVFWVGSYQTNFYKTSFFNVSPIL